MLLYILLILKLILNELNEWVVWTTVTEHDNVGSDGHKYIITHMMCPLKMCSSHLDIFFDWAITKWTKSNRFLWATVITKATTCNAILWTEWACKQKTQNYSNSSSTNLCSVHIVSTGINTICTYIVCVNKISRPF